MFAVLTGRRVGALKLRPHKEIFTMTALMRRTVIIRIVRKYVTIDVPFPLLSGVSPSLKTHRHSQTLLSQLVLRNHVNARKNYTDLIPIL